MHVYSYSGSGAGAGSVDPVRPEVLDAGTAININGPKGAKQLVKDANSGGFYFAQLGGGAPSIPGVPQQGQPDYLEPGSYRIDNGSGGSHVGAFTTSFTLPAALTWTNMDAVNTIPRASGQTVTWTGGDPAGYVSIVGSSVGDNIVSGFYCTERVSAGSFNIPSYVLLNLPASSGLIGGSLALSGATSIPITPTPSGLDAAAISISSGNSKTVTFQ
jgi:hypothetical protein